MSSPVTSWVHLFSKFSSEALLFEAFLVCAGIALYAAWYIFKKRRELAAEEQIPGSVVKVYLNELITEAEQMRGQLYALLKASGGKIPEGFHLPSHGAESHAAVQAAAQAAAHSAHVETSASSSPNPELLAKVVMLEARMKEQAQAMETLVSEKVRIERDLELAKSSASRGVTGASSSDESAELRRKIQALEAKLSEYSVIEDDLASLKRLQQENSALKQQLSQKPEPAPAPAPAPVVAAAPAPEPSPAPAPEPAPAPQIAEIAPTPELSPEAELVAAPVPEPVVEGSSEISLPSLEPQVSSAQFDALTEQVDQSLKAEAKDPVAPAPAEAAPAAASPAPAAPAEEPKKSEADLLAEFEKMING